MAHNLIHRGLAKKNFKENTLKARLNIVFPENMELKLIYTAQKIMK